MAELVAVLNDSRRAIINDLGQVHTLESATVVGLRVDDGPMFTATGKERTGKEYERRWRAPDPLAFATQAFYKVVFCDRAVPPGEYYDCHAYHDFALGYSDRMTWPNGEWCSEVVRERLPTLPVLMKPGVGYTVLRNKGQAVPDGGTRVHSFIALPRRLGVTPESLGVTRIGGDLVVAKTSSLPSVYGGQKFYRTSCEV